MAARPVLVVAEQVDAAADMVVDQLNQRDVPVIRFDAARFPQEIQLTGEHGRSAFGWNGRLDVGQRSVRLAEVRGVYYRRPGRSVTADSVPMSYAPWAQAQADAAMLNLLAALPVPWINNPHTDRPASHKPQQLALAHACGLAVPRSLITNSPSEARAFVVHLGGHAVCKPLLGGRIDVGGKRLMVPTHRVSTADVDDSVRLTATYLQEEIRKDYEVRLCAVDGNMYAAALYGTSAAARLDWRTDYDAIEYQTVPVPPDVAAGVQRFMSHYGIIFGAFDFAVTPAGRWVFFENNPSGTWAWVENRTGLPIAAAHASYLQGENG